MSRYRRRIPRVCVACGADQPPFYGLPDPCIGRMLEGVANACCGHGCVSLAYVHFQGDERGENVLRGLTARRYLTSLGIELPPPMRAVPTDNKISFAEFVGWAIKDSQEATT